jgi:hypothetical protein
LRAERATDRVEQIAARINRSRADRIAELTARIR